MAQVLADRANEVGARISFEGNDFGLLTRDVAVGGQQLSIRGLAGDYDDLFLPLHGAHQAHNTVVALAAVEAFLGGGEQRLDPELVRAGLAAVASPGRLEIVRRSPTVIVDAAHNVAGALALRNALEDSFNFARMVGVLAILKDKPATEMLEILEPVLDHVVVTRTTSPRAMRPDELGELAADIFGEDRVTVVHELPDALDVAAGLADEGGGVSGGVLATGSVTTAARGAHAARHHGGLTPHPNAAAPAPGADGERLRGAGPRGAGGAGRPGGGIRPYSPNTSVSRRISRRRGSVSPRTQRPTVRTDTPSRRAACGQAPGPLRLQSGRQPPGDRAGCDGDVVRGAPDTWARGRAVQHLDLEAVGEQPHRHLERGIPGAGGRQQRLADGGLHLGRGGLLGSALRESPLEEVTRLGPGGRAGGKGPGDHHDG